MKWLGQCAECGEEIGGFGQVPIPKPGEKVICLLCLALAKPQSEREQRAAQLAEAA